MSKLVLFAVLAVFGGLLCLELWKEHQCKELQHSDLWRGRVVLITGASSGIGADLAKTYAKLGSHVILAARRQDQLTTIADECTTLGASSVLTVAVDLGITDDCDRLLQAVKSRYGNALDALILNHAISDNKLLLEFPDERTTASQVAEHYERVMRINWLSLPVLIRLAFPLLHASSGHISLISSGSTMFPVPFHPAYISSKFAMNGLLGSLHEEFSAVGVRQRVSLGVVIVGLVATPMVSYFNASVLDQIALPSDICARGIMCTVHRREEWSYVPGWMGWVLPITRVLPAPIRTLMAEANFINLVEDFRDRIAQVRNQLLEFGR